MLSNMKQLCKDKPIYSISQTIKKSLNFDFQVF